MSRLKSKSRVGSWTMYARRCWSASRYTGTPGGRIYDLGFRVLAVPAAIILTMVIDHGTITA